MVVRAIRCPEPVAVSVTESGTKVFLACVPPPFSACPLVAVCVISRQFSSEKFALEVLESVEHVRRMALRSLASLPCCGFVIVRYTPGKFELYPKAPAEPQNRELPALH